MAFPSDLTRTKNWGTEILTDSDLEGQFDLIINWVMAALNSTTGHSHDGTSNQGPKVSASVLTIASQAQGDLLYASSASAWARLGYGTAGYQLRTGGSGANPSWAIPPSSGGFSNLSVSRTNVTTVAVTADRLTVFDTNNVGWLCTSVNVSPAITSSGANGLDTGAEGSSRWYYIWIIRKSSDGTVAGLLSESSTAPTMPSGYDQKTLVSAVYNSSGSDFTDFKQIGRRYSYTSWRTLTSGNIGTGAWVSTSTVAFVPSGLSNYCYGTVKPSSTGAITNDNTVATGATTDRNKYGGTPGSGSTRIERWELDIITANTLYALGDSADYIVYIHGFDVNKLV